jgi:hypothetical protein
MIEANATDLRDRFADQFFDIVFSNSVTKPVGDESQQRAFAREVLRLGKAHGIPTPRNHFPIAPLRPALLLVKVRRQTPTTSNQAGQRHASLDRDGARHKGSDPITTQISPVASQIPSRATNAGNDLTRSSSRHNARRAHGSSPPMGIIQPEL